MQKLSKFTSFLFILFSLFILNSYFLIAPVQAACGENYQVCCSTPGSIACNVSGSSCIGGHCVPGNACGSAGMACCPGDTCNNGLDCISGSCGSVPSSGSSAFPELRYPCEKPGLDPEFHSLRPYQAAHCGDAGKARYCSNDLKFVETFDDFPQCVNDAPDVDGAVFDCSLNPPFQVPIHNLVVTLDDSMFPIMGNTEEVKNHDPNSSDIFDDATKVNEYASWYLSGVNNRAEYGENTDERVVNFSGPVQKLLPKMIQEAERINTINKAAIDGEPWTDPDDGKTYTTPQNHNQVVVCGDSNLGWFGGLLNIGKITPVPCYNADEKFRLKDEGVLGDGGWYGGDLSDFNGLFNRIGTDIWNKRTPPLPWNDGTGKPFETQTKYQKAYSEWKGQSCATIPFIDMNLCIDNPFVPNKWAQLYQYIPLSNTTDKKGNEYLNPEHPIYNPADGTEIELGNPPNDTPKNAPLYFAHTQEVKESSELLNKTFTPQECSTESGTLECKLLENKRGSVEANNCSVANIRVNKGDNLFPGDPNEIQVPNVNYSITQVRCKVKYKEIPCRGHLAAIGQCPNPPFIKKTVTCHAEVAITLKTWTKTPNADEIFNSTVAGTGSTFRKIFPKVEEGAPVSCIADIPTVTDVTYTGTNTLQGGDSVFSVARYPEDGAGSNPQLTFPHIGSVYEYFLKGIQTALRPKGYGEPITSGTLCSSLDGGDCSFDMTKINNAIKNAASKYNVPEKLLKSIFEIESYEYIADPSSYVCEENFAGAAGVAQIVKDTYEYVTCGDEKMDNDIPMCGDNHPKLSRCNIDDAFELMARILLLKAGRWNSSSCTASSGITESEKMVWYDASCNYYGSHSPDSLTIGLQNDIPVASRRPNGDMNYCDVVCYKMGQCPAYP